MDESKNDPSADPGAGPHGRASTALVNSVGIFGGVFGVIFAVATLPTLWLKIIGLAACVSATGLALQAAHDRDRGRLGNKMLAWLVATGGVVLVLVMSTTALVPATPSTERTDDADRPAASSGTAESYETTADSPVSEPTPPPVTQTTQTPADPASPVYRDKTMKLAPPACGLSSITSWSIDFDTPAVNVEHEDLRYQCEDYGLIESWDAMHFGDAPSGSVTADSCRDAAQTTGRSSINVAEVVADETAWCVVTHSGQVAWVRVTGKGAPFSEYGELPTLTLLVTVWPAS